MYHAAKKIRQKGNWKWLLTIFTLTLFLMGSAVAGVRAGGNRISLNPLVRPPQSTPPPPVLAHTVDITPVVTIDPVPPKGAGYRPQLTRTHAWDFSSASNTLGTVVTVDNVVRLFLFRLKTGVKFRDVEVSRRSERFKIRNIAFSPEGSRIAIPMGDERKVTIWNVESGVKETEGTTAEM